MASIVLSAFIIFFSVLLIVANGANVTFNNNITLNDNSTFSKNYYPLWGLDHFALVNQSAEVQLRFDNYSGAGFRSKLVYKSGLFRIRMKIPNKPTGGVVTTFYLNSAKYGQDDKPHDEIDFEFVGTKGILQTNVFANDLGKREQQFQLWFDPSKDFHTYAILWNQNQIVFFVDEIPIRVFKNFSAQGVNHPSRAMRIEASIWSANWAGKVDWSKIPFIAHYREFSITGCPYVTSNICKSSKFFWNQGDYWELSPSQMKLLESYKKKYMVYDYCTNGSKEHPECSKNP